MANEPKAKQTPWDKLPAGGKAVITGLGIVAGVLGAMTSVLLAFGKFKETGQSVGLFPSEATKTVIAAPATPAPNVISTPAQSPATSRPSIVYITYSPSSLRATAEELRALLNQRGYKTPEIELIAYPFSSDVKYFYASDKVLADDILASTKTFLNQRSLLVQLTETNYPENAAGVPIGQIELWLNLSR